MKREQPDWEKSAGWIEELFPATSRLALEWDLNECEAGDLLSFGLDMKFAGKSQDLVQLHLETKAELLSLFGSEAQETFDMLERMTWP